MNTPNEQPWRPLEPGEEADVNDTECLTPDGAWVKAAGCHGYTAEEWAKERGRPPTLRTRRPRPIPEPEWRPLEAGEKPGIGDRKDIEGFAWETRRPRPAQDPAPAAQCPACEKPAHHAGIHTCINPAPAAPRRSERMQSFVDELSKVDERVRAFLGATSEAGDGAGGSDQQTARDWVASKTIHGMYRQHDGINIYDALVIADRADRAEAALAKWEAEHGHEWVHRRVAEAERDALRTEIGAWRCTVEAREADIKKLRCALEFYADEIKHGYPLSDDGRVAREALNQTTNDQ